MLRPERSRGRDATPFGDSRRQGKWIVLWRPGLCCFPRNSREHPLFCLRSAAACSSVEGVQPVKGIRNGNGMSCAGGGCDSVESTCLEHFSRSLLTAVPADSLFFFRKAGIVLFRHGDDPGHATEQCPRQKDGKKAQGQFQRAGERHEYFRQELRRLGRQVHPE